MKYSEMRAILALAFLGTAYGWAVENLHYELALLSTSPVPNKIFNITDKMEKSDRLPYIVVPPLATANIPSENLSETLHITVKNENVVSPHVLMPPSTTTEVNEQVYVPIKIKNPSYVVVPLLATSNPFHVSVNTENITTPSPVSIRNVEVTLSTTEFTLYPEDKPKQTKETEADLNITYTILNPIINELHSHNVMTDPDEDFLSYTKNNNESTFVTTPGNNATSTIQYVDFSDHHRDPKIFKPVQNDKVETTVKSILIAETHVTDNFTTNTVMTDPDEVFLSHTKNNTESTFVTTPANNSTSTIQYVDFSDHDRDPKIFKPVQNDKVETTVKSILITETHATDNFTISTPPVKIENENIVDLVEIDNERTTVQSAEISYSKTTVPYVHFDLSPSTDTYVPINESSTTTEFVEIKNSRSSPESLKNILITTSQYVKNSSVEDTTQALKEDGQTSTKSNNVDNLLTSVQTIKIDKVSTTTEPVKNDNLRTVVEALKIFKMPFHTIQFLPIDKLPTTVKPLQRVEHLPTVVVSEQNNVLRTNEVVPEAEKSYTDHKPENQLIQANQFEPEGHENEATTDDTVAADANISSENLFKTYHIAYSTLLNIIRSAIAAQTSYDSLTKILADTVKIQRKKLPLSHRVEVVKSPSILLSALKFAKPPLQKVNELVEKIASKKLDANLRSAIRRHIFTGVLKKIIQNFITAKLKGFVNGHPDYITVERQNHDLGNPYAHKPFETLSELSEAYIPAANPFLYNSDEPLDSLSRLKILRNPVNELDAQMSPVIIMDQGIIEPEIEMTPLVTVDSTPDPIASNDYVSDSLFNSGYDQNMFASENIWEPSVERSFHRDWKKIDCESNKRAEDISENYEDNSSRFFRRAPLIEAIDENIPTSPLAVLFP